MVPPYEILVFLTNFIFFGAVITLWGKKRTAFFQTHNWEMSSFFGTLVRVFAELFANTRQGGHNVPPPGPYRVKEYFNFTGSSVTYNTVQCSAEDGFCALQSIIFHLSALSCPSFPWRSQSLITSLCHFFRSLNKQFFSQSFGKLVMGRKEYIQL